MTVGIMTVGIMTVGIMTVGIMTVGKMTVGIMTVGLNDNWYKTPSMYPLATTVKYFLTRVAILIY
jgi:hypothetical protein